MTNIKKKLTAFAVTLAMLFALLPLGVFQGISVSAESISSNIQINKDITENSVIKGIIGMITVSKNATLTIKNNSTFTIENGSTLIIESGTTLEI